MSDPRKSAYIPEAVARRLSAAYEVDSRSLRRELAVPGSVRGMAGERARAALSEMRRAAQEG